MHAGGLHSALAIKRQRKRRDEQKRARERRFSSHSTESGLTSPHNSMGSLDRYGSSRRHVKRHGSAADTAVVSSIGMLHIGVVFLVLGVFLLVSGLLPDNWSHWNSNKWWNELVCTGAFASGIGIFLIVLHFIISKHEEDDLNNYVQNQLTRSRSGHRLERDVETGVLTTKHHRRARQKQQEDLERGLTDFSPIDDDYPGVHNSSVRHSLNGNDSDNLRHNIEENGHLSKIVEEDVLMSNSERLEIEIRKMEMLDKETLSATTTATLSPGSPSETRELLSGVHFNNSRYIVAKN